MKAAIYRQYGPPEVVHITEMETPMPSEEEVRIKIYTTTVNRTDSGFRSAEYFVSRFWSGLFRPKYPILGCEFAGEIDQVGNNVKSFTPGQKVFGYNDARFGGHAEYIIARETDPIATIPDGFSFEEAAALTEGAHYALGNIRAAKVKAGDNVLVYGATGAIGTAAVQLLKYFGASVTAVANTKNVELVWALGADEVIDYQTQDFTQTTKKFSFVFDAVGKSSFGQCKPLMTPRGIYVSTELGKGGQNIWYALITPLFKGKKVIFPIPTMKKADIEWLQKVATEGRFKPVIDRAYTLNQIVEAYRYVETGQKTGNVIIKISE